MAESTSFNVCKSSSFTNHHFLLKFLFKRVTKYLFHHCHKKEIPLKRHLNIFFRLIFSASEDFVKVSQKILWHPIEFVSGFILLQNPSTNYHYVCGTFSIQQLAVVLFFMRCSIDIQTMYFKVKQSNSKTLMQCSTKYVRG